jgi:hypothetical protein
LGAAGRVRAARRTTRRVPRDAVSAVPDEHGHGAAHNGHAIFWPCIGIGAGEVEFTSRFSCFSFIYILDFYLVHILEAIISYCTDLCWDLFSHQCYSIQLIHIFGLILPWTAPAEAAL